MSATIVVVLRRGVAANALDLIIAASRPCAARTERRASSSGAMLRSLGLGGQATQSERFDHGRHRTGPAGLGSVPRRPSAAPARRPARSPGLREGFLAGHRQQTWPKTPQTRSGPKKRLALRIGGRGDLVAVQLVIACADSMASEEDEAAVVRVADDAGGAGGLGDGGVQASELHGDVWPAQARCHAGGTETCADCCVLGGGTVLQGRDGAGAGARGWKVQQRMPTGTHRTGERARGPRTSIVRGRPLEPPPPSGNTAPAGRSRRSSR